MAIQPTQPSSTMPKRLAAAGALVVIAAAVLILTLHPQARTWMHQHLVTQHLSIGAGITYITLPIIGIATSLVILKHKHNEKPELRELGLKDPKVQYKLKKSAAITSVALLTLGAMAALHFFPLIPHYTLPAGVTLISCAMPPLALFAIQQKKNVTQGMYSTICVE